MKKQAFTKASREITIFDVAERAGVAISTVSQALRGRRDVAPATREAVLKAARELNYLPNVAAQSLARRQSNIIAVCGWFVHDSLEGQAYSTQQLLSGILARLKGMRFAVHIVNWSTHPNEHRRLLRDIQLQRFICGSIWLTPGRTRRDEALIRSSKLPLAFAEVEHPSVDSVSVDNQLGARLGAAHLLQSCRRLALVAGNPKGSNQRDRIAGVKQALRDAGMGWKKAMMFLAPRYSLGDGLMLAPRIAALAKKPGAAKLGVFCLAGDRTALSLMHGLRSKGISVPGQIKVLGWDGVPECAYFNPTLSTVEQPLFDVGFKTCELLLNRLEGLKGPVQNLKLEPRLMLRESA